MPREREERNDTAGHESGLPGGGKGRRDEVGGSGVYPASAADVPEDAAVRTPGDWGKGAGGEEGGRSELSVSEEELRAAEESDPGEGQGEGGR